MQINTRKTISPRISLISAFLMHCFVEIPFFIFPVIILIIGSDLFPDLGSLSWLGLGSLGTIGTLAMALPSPIFGKLADKYRRGLMMFISLILSASGSLIIGLFGYSFLVMIVAVTLMGIGISLYHPPGLSWVSTAFEDPETHSYSSNYVKILALHGIGGSLGCSIGPISIYLLIDKMDWHQIYFYWSIPLFLLAIGFWFLVGRYEMAIKQPIFSRSIINTKSSIKILNNGFSGILLVIYAFICIMSLARGMINFILSPFLSETKNIEIATAALFIGISTLLGAIGQVIGGYFSDKYGEKVVLAVSAIIQVFVLSGIFFIETRLILLILYIFLAIINSLFWPSTNSLVAKNSQKRGIAFGWVMLVANFIGALGPTVDGILLVVTPNQYFLIFGLASLFSFIGFVFLIFVENNSPFKLKGEL